MAFNTEIHTSAYCHEAHRLVHGHIFHMKWQLHS